MTNEEFEVWCLKNNLLDKAKMFISRIRSSQPARTVGNRFRNVKGAYASKKNGFTVQFESHTAELCGIYSYEYSTDVLEYYDQPEIIYVGYKDKNGNTRPCEYYPDFLVITEDGAFLDEWKIEDQLVKLSSEYPDRYCLGNDGVWHFPPGEEFAKGLGIRFRVRSTSEVNRILYRNLQFLEDYLRHDTLSVQADIELLVVATVRNAQGITLEELIRRLAPKVTVDHIYIMIVSEIIFVDLEKYLLVEPEYALVYTDEDIAGAIKTFDVEPPTLAFQDLRPVMVDTGQRLVWDGVPMSIELVGTSAITLKQNDGKLKRIEKPFFDKFVREGIITGLVSPQAALKNEALSIILNAGKKYLAEANRRYNIILPYLNGERVSGTATPERTVFRYLARYRHAEKKYGYGYIGLLPTINLDRERKSKLPKRTLELFEVAKKDYQSNKQQGKKAVYKKFCTHLENEGLQIISLRSFRKLLRKAMTKHEETEGRKGERAAYKFEHIDWTQNVIPTHGDWPFHLAHIDSTLLDLELVSKKTGKNLGKMWVTKMIDAYAHRYLGITASFDPPSYRSVMNVLRECVRRFGRLPHTIITDNGKEFDNVYFISLISYFGITRKLRPPSSPRFGSIQERLIGTMNSTFIYNLIANTQITKNVRDVTQRVNPKNLAIWSPLRLYERLCEWAYEVYDTMTHPALGMSPCEAFEKGMAISGQREHMLIPYDRTFYMMTLPSTKKGTAKVQPGLGLKINGSYYNCQAFKDPGVENTNLEVRYEPYNLGVAYAYVDKTWVRCLSQYYNVFKDKSERDVQFYSEELRKQMRMQGKDFTPSAKQLAEFILSVEVEENEALELRRLRNTENRDMLTMLSLPEIMTEKEPLDNSQKTSFFDDGDDNGTLTIYEEVA